MSICLRAMKGCCEAGQSRDCECRLLELLTPVKNRKPGFEWLCKECFEKEVNWRNMGGLYGVFTPPPEWSDAQIFNKPKPRGRTGRKKKS